VIYQPSHAGLKPTAKVATPLRGPRKYHAARPQDFNLTLRPMKYPDFYEMYKNSIKNTWTVEEVDFSTDVTDLRAKMTRPSGI
jgi:hypothetical protein